MQRQVDQGGAAPTIRDVAREARVSPSTVSNLLNGRDERMRLVTRQRVWRVIEELGYRPSRVARQLRTGRAQVLGLIVPSVANPFWGGFAQLLELAALERGYQVLLCNSHRNAEREKVYVEELWASGVRAIVLGTSLPSLEHLTEPIQRGLRVVAFDREPQPDDPRVISLSVDNYIGSLLATRHLLSLGHRRVGLISGPIATVSRQRRLAGYQEALAEAGVDGDPALIWAGSASDFGDIGSSEQGREGMSMLLQLPDPPTGVVTINDMYALGSITAAREHGLEVPADISIVGFDDIDIASLVTPPLTTVHQPLAEMARLAAGMLLDEGVINSDFAWSTTLPPTLVIRGTTAEVRGRGVAQ